MATLNALQKAGFSTDEARKIEVLRRRHRRARLHEQFTPEELRRLELIRWLLRRGRLSA